VALPGAESFNHLIISRTQVAREGKIMAGMENDRQAEYVRILQIALEDAWRAAMHLDDPNYFSQKQFLIMELAKAKAYASQLKPGPANDAASKDTHEIGAIENSGEHKGEIYGGIYPADKKPIWISEEPEPISHYAAAELKGRALPTSEQGKYIDTIKDRGALKDIFARHSDSSSSAGYFWLAEHYGYGARYQQFSDGSQYNYYDVTNINYRVNHLPVLSVRR
jgi:hypothetical protein